MTLGTRLPENPLLDLADVPPSRANLEVIGVSNAATAKVGDEIILLLRVAERPRADIDIPDDACTVDLDGPEPHLLPLPAAYRRHELVGFIFLDTRHGGEGRLIVAYLPKDLPGLDLSDPRAIRYRGASSLRLTNNGWIDYLSSMSHLRVARSRDGVHFDVDREPAIFPREELEEYGVEDPRASLIDGVWHITYVSVSRVGITTSLATTKDFRSFRRHGIIFLPDNKDVVLFPHRFDGSYVALHRPMPQSFGRIFGIWSSTSKDLRHWGDHRPIALPRWERWDEMRTGASAVPFLTPSGWLELYHGVDRTGRYAMGALLLDAEDPHVVLARSPEPILLPTDSYEKVGLYGNVVFSCGHVPLDDHGDRIRLYYGAADTCIAAADFAVRDILLSLTPVPTPDRLLVD